LPRHDEEQLILFAMTSGEQTVYVVWMDCPYSNIGQLEAFFADGSLVGAALVQFEGAELTWHDDLEEYRHGFPRGAVGDCEVAENAARFCQP
jgi:hypothetical protein